MNKMDLETLNAFVNSLHFEIACRVPNTIEAVFVSDRKWVMRDETRSTLVNGINSFNAEIMTPLLDKLVKQYEGHLINGNLLAIIKTEIIRHEETNVANGKLSYKDELRKRLGIPTVISRLEFEMNLVFREALKDHPQTKT